MLRVLHIVVMNITTSEKRRRRRRRRRKKRNRDPVWFLIANFRSKFQQSNSALCFDLNQINYVKFVELDTLSSIPLC